MQNQRTELCSQHFGCCSLKSRKRY